MRAPAVYGVLQRMTQGEDCASEVVFPTFVEACSQGGALVTLTALIHTAIASACSAADEAERPALEGRIKMWYSEAFAERLVREVASA